MKRRSSSRSKKKRPHSAVASPASPTTAANNENRFELPHGDLTADRLEEWMALATDRQKFAWALQTEARVRLKKLQQETTDWYSPTLESGNYLLDIYPMPPQEEQEEEEDCKPAAVQSARVKMERKEEEEEEDCKPTAVPSARVKMEREEDGDSKPAEVLSATAKMEHEEDCKPEAIPSAAVKMEQEHADNKPAAVPSAIVKMEQENENDCKPAAVPRATVKMEQDDDDRKLAALPIPIVRMRQDDNDSSSGTDDTDVFDLDAMRAELEQDQRELARSSLNLFQESRQPDDSMSQLDEISLGRGYTPHEYSLNHEHAKEALPDRPNNKDNEEDLEMFRLPVPVPPNFLFFHWILQGYMGYKFPAYQGSNDAPRGAIMGGAVIAALTAWRHSTVRSLFRSYMLGPDENDDDDDDDDDDYIWSRMLNLLRPAHDAMLTTPEDLKFYRACKRLILLDLNDYFIHRGRTIPNDTNDSSGEPFRQPAPSRYPDGLAVFCEGDVDIFFQSSQGPENTLYQQKRDRQSSNIGELYPIAQQFEDCILTQGPREFSDMEGPVYALTNQGLSFQYASTNERDFEDYLWPRCSQLIMLHPKADLLGGLLDFDLSCVAVAFDGTTVRATPRAALSLISLVQVVTPFIWTERRNRTRIVKYWKRGFRPYVMDPNCRHVAKQCPVTENHAKLVISKPDPSLVVQTNARDVSRGNIAKGDWKSFSAEDGQFFDHEATVKLKKNHPILRCDQNVSTSKFSEVEELQRTKKVFMACRCKKKYSEPLDFEPGFFSLVLFETSNDDALRYFNNGVPKYEDYDMKNGSEDKSNNDETLQGPIDPWLLVACGDCRFQYYRDAVAVQCKSAIGRYDVEPLHEELASQGWSYGTSHVRSVANRSGKKVPWGNFYCGPTFDARLARCPGFHRMKAIRRLWAKENMEQCQQQSRRFLSGLDLEWLFKEISRATLKPPGRNPVGLNPERFVNKCLGCTDTTTWLMDCEYSVKYCEMCVGE